MEDDLIYDELKNEWLGQIAAENVPHQLLKLALRLQHSLGQAPTIDVERAYGETPVN